MRLFARFAFPRLTPARLLPHDRGILRAASTIVALLALVLAGGAAAVFVHARLAAGPAIVARAPAAPPPLWLDVPRPIHIFSLEAPVLHGMPLVYSARRRSAGDGREDMMAFGALGTDTPALRLRLFRRAAAGEAPPPLFAAIARQAAEAGLAVGRSGLADLMPTRFGKFEIADVTLTDPAMRRVPCSGFRLVLDTPGLTIAGLACGAGDKPMERGALACLIDRLDLASGGEDRALIDFFAATERRRNLQCGGARLAPDTLHAAWLDDKPATPRQTSRRH